jgi:hypothetical protein
MQSACAVLYCHMRPVSHKQYDFREKVNERKNVFTFYTRLSETFLTLRTERDIIIHVLMYLCKIPVIFLRDKWNLNFLNRFSKYP